MMKILIADDEYLVRATLRSMLIDIGFSDSNIDEVDNGIDLLQHLSITPYQIAFVDIKMPFMDGLNAIEQGKELSKQTKWVIITGYSEFDFAKKAIQLGVTDYLLKPVNPSTLEALIEQILGSWKELVRIENQLFESEINTYYSELIDTLSLNEKIHSFGSIHLMVDTYATESKKLCLKEIYQTLSTKIDGTITETCNIVFLNGTQADLSLVIGGNTFDTIYTSLINTCKRISKQFNTKEMHISVISTPVVSTITELFSFIRTTENLLELRFLTYKKEITSLSMLKDVLLNANSYDLDNAKHLHLLFKSLNEENMPDFMSHLESLRINRVQLEDYLTCTVDLNNDASMYSTLQKLGEKELQDQILESSSIVNMIKEYVNLNYMHNIGVNQIAIMLDLTPNYLSSLFKKKEGITFMKYLTKIRMHEAHVLLLRGDQKVADVAKNVGFLSTRHFSKLYKETYAINPSDYTSSLQ